MDESGPQGHILIEVDDLSTQWNGKHGETPENLQVRRVEEHLQQ